MRLLWMIPTLYICILFSVSCENRTKPSKVSSNQSALSSVNDQSSEAKLLYKSALNHNRLGNYKKALEDLKSLEKINPDYRESAQLRALLQKELNGM